MISRAHQGKERVESITFTNLIFGNIEYMGDLKNFMENYNWKINYFDAKEF